MQVDAHARTSQHERDESASERADRNFAELVQELRVAQTGVQILFAFLLSLTFLSTFPRDDALFGVVLTLALLTSAAAALTFISPVVVHRLHFRRGLKEQLVDLTHRLALIGLALLVTAMDLAIWLVLAALWTPVVATAVAVALVPVGALLWVVLPSRAVAPERGGAAPPEQPRGRVTDPAGGAPADDAGR